MTITHKEIMNRYSVRAKKSLGQNFLTSENSLNAIADAVQVEGKNIVEVWPGYGALTERLLSRNPESLTLVELDKDMVWILEDRRTRGELVMKDGRGFQIVPMDILKYTPSTPSYSVIANIPYYITSPILYRFLYELPVRPESMVILMQKEVADRIRAKDSKQSYLSLFCQISCDNIEEVEKVPAGCFVPAPKVDSAVLRFILKPSFDREKSIAMLKVFSVGFSSPRKKLASNLANGLGISKEKIAELIADAGLREDIRPEAVSLEKWIEIAEKMV